MNADADTAKEAGENIERTIDAIEELRKLSIELPDMRLQLDRLLRFWERKWFFIEPDSHREGCHDS